MNVRMMSRIFTIKDRPKLCVLTILMVLGGLLEVAGIGLLFPYISVLQDDPGEGAAIRFVTHVYGALGIRSHVRLVLAMSATLLVIFVAKGLFTLWLTNFQLKFV